MALTAILGVAAHKALSNELQGHYTQRDEQFVLSVVAVGGMELADNTKLKKSLQTERGQREAAEKKAATLTTQFEGMDPKEAREALHKIKELGDFGDPEKKLAAHKEAFEQQVKDKYAGDQKQLMEKHKSEMDATEAAHTKTKGQLRRELITSNATTAIAAAGGSVDLLLQIVTGMTQMKETDTGEFVAEVMGDDGLARLGPKPGSTAAMTIEDLVAELKGNEVYGPAFNGSGAGGSGATGGNAPHVPGSTPTISAEEARDPAKYQVMKAVAVEAGVELQITD